jgi:hypothetical protein
VCYTVHGNFTETFGRNKTGASTAFPYANHAGLPVWAEPETTRFCIIASVAMPVVAPEQCSCADSKRRQKKSPRRAAASGSSWPGNRRIFAHFRSEEHRPSDLAISMGRGCGKR